MNSDFGNESMTWDGTKSQLDTEKEWSVLASNASRGHIGTLTTTHLKALPGVEERVPFTDTTSPPSVSTSDPQSCGHTQRDKQGITKQPAVPPSTLEWWGQRLIMHMIGRRTL